MRDLGAAFGGAAQPGDVLLLRGPFGAGKTTFVQGLARGLGVPSAVTSPSFVIVNQYQGRMPLAHIDLYRLEHLHPAFLEELEEHLFGEGVSAVEWPDQLPPDLQEGATSVSFSVDGPDTRLVEVVPGRGDLGWALHAAALR